MNPETLHKYGHHAPTTEDHRQQIEKSRKLFADLADALTTLLPPGREAAVANTHLETASFWANAAIARAWCPANPIE